MGNCIRKDNTLEIPAELRKQLAAGQAYEQDEVTSSGYGSGDGAHLQLNWSEIVSATNSINFKILEEDLERNPTLFLTNNIALSIQFFKNFDRDKEDAQKMKEAQKSEFDSKLAELKKYCLVNPSVLTKVNEYVTYRTPEGELQGLINEEYVICQNNIEVDSKMRSAEEVTQYTNLDDHTYRLSVEESRRIRREDMIHPGFVRVRCNEDYSAIMSRRSLSEKIGNSLPNSNTEKVERYLSTLPSQPFNGDISPGSRSPELNSPSLTPSNKKQISYPWSIKEEAVKKEDIDDTSNNNSHGFTEQKKSFGPSDREIRKTASFDSLEDLKRISSIIEEDEEGKEDGETAGDNFRDHVNKFVENNKNTFGPSEREIRKGANFDLLDVSSRLQNRRPSGVMPNSYIKMTEKETRYKQKRKKEKHESEGIPEEKQLGTKQKSTESSQPDTGSKSDDDSYGYVANNKLPFVIKQGEQAPRGSIIPENCFEDREVEIFDHTHDEDENMPEITSDRETIKYLTSKGMMEYFMGQYPTICEMIGKPEFTDGNTVTEQPSMYSMETVDNKSIFWKFTSSLECGFFPQKCTPWVERKRIVMRDKKTGLEYQWPSKEQIDAVKTIGFNIVPLGFVHPRKNHKNVFSSIEWEIKFFKAENLISRSLHYPKLKVYLLSLVLHKAYLEDILALREEHLRYCLYEMIERSPGEWTEENVGEKLIQLLKKILHYLKKQRMPHYFLPSCNMFASIANHKLQESAEAVFRITENPVFYLLDAVQNLRYEANFYPRLNAWELYKILSNSAKNKLNVMFGNQSGNKTRNVVEDEPAWDSMDRYQVKMREEYDKTRGQAEQKKKLEMEKKPKHHIDKMTELRRIDDWKKSDLLEFLVQHFIRMAEQSNVYRNHGQAFMYTQHAENLLKLLSGPDLSDSDASPFDGLKVSIFRLKEIQTDMNKKDYWNISFGHPKLVHSNSFRSTDIPSIPLPSLPNSESSPIPGTKRNDDIPTKRGTTLISTADVHHHQGESLPANGGQPQLLSLSSLQSAVDSIDLGYTPEEADDESIDIRL